MSFLCKLFGCNKNCDDVREQEQDDCERRLSEVRREHEAEYKKLRKIKNRWEMKFARVKGLRNGWREQAREWKEKYNECRDEPVVVPSKAIKSLTIRDGKFIVNGIQRTLIGVSKREMICASAGVVSKSYDPHRVKTSIIASDTNYIRVFAPKDLAFFRQEVIDYLEAGKVVEVELFDAGKPDREYQANWLDTFNAVRDLPIIFDAHNEFVNQGGVKKADEIVNYVVAHSGLISAGAWGSSTHGKATAGIFKTINNKYQIVSHHREWIKSSIDEDRESGKPLILNELHSRDVTLLVMKNVIKSFLPDVQGIQIYSLQNWGIGENSNFQKILDYAGSLVK